MKLQTIGNWLTHLAFVGAVLFLIQEALKFPWYVGIVPTVILPLAMAGLMYAFVRAARNPFR